MYDYGWNYFPGRLHSTREIIYFLEHMKDIQSILETHPPELTNTIFGDICHSGIRKDVLKWIKEPLDLAPIQKLILEVCSRTAYYYGNIPLNHFYVLKNPQLIHTYKLQLIELSHEEIEKDIAYIQSLAKTLFSPTVQVHIVPHLNLKTRTLKDYIPKRKLFVQSLQSICLKLQIPFHNIGAYIEEKDPSSYLEDYMADSTHYSNGYEKVKEFLVRSV